MKTPTDASIETDNDITTDGRRARRERGRLAVSEAMIDLVLEGHLPPTTEEIAERASVSIASLFRYFDTLDDLRRETTELYFDRYAHLFAITDIGEGPLPERVDRFVDARATLYETTEPMCRLVRVRAHEIDAVSDMVSLVFASRADQIRHHFDLELSAMTPDAAEDATAVISTVTSFESWDQMCHILDRSHAQVRRAWAGVLHQILPASRSSPRVVL
jgi:AcrR family transcriptional regulator